MHSSLAPFFHISPSQAICNAFLPLPPFFLSFNKRRNRFYYFPILHASIVTFPFFISFARKLFWKYCKQSPSISFWTHVFSEPNSTNFRERDSRKPQQQLTRYWKITTRYFVSFLSFHYHAVRSFRQFPSFVLHLPIVSSLSFCVSFCSTGLSFELFHAYRYVRHVQFYEGKHIRRADGRRLIKAWVCALGVLVSTALGAGDDVAVWTPMASSRRPTTNVGRGRRRRRRQRRWQPRLHSLQARSDTKWSFFKNPGNVSVIWNNTSATALSVTFRIFIEKIFTNLPLFPFRPYVYGLCPFSTLFYVELTHLHRVAEYSASDVRSVSPNVE